MEIKDGVNTYYAQSREVWRQWLESNHDQEDSVWLIIYKKESDVPSVYYPEAVDEALCFGWVDSKPNKRDQDSYYQYFARRNPKSNWSKVNKEKVGRLLKENRITKPGLEMIALAKENGTWNALDEVENLIIPADLEQELAKYNQAEEHFQQLPKSVKRGILEWIYNAKRPETRLKRIEETARLAEKNIRANQYRN